jgi:dTDP-4-amino-4,6-dideoxygalactose transaminase
VKHGPSSIAFNVPDVGDAEKRYIAEVFANAHFAGDGPFTRRCHSWIEAQTGTAKALLTHSCTAAMEMAALLLDIAPGDEIIMPSFTFVSTANAFVLRGGVPIFVDIREDTQNLDEQLIEAAITPRTRAIVPVHYAGVGCEMDSIGVIASRHGLAIVEDAAQGVMARYKGRPLGTMGDFGAYSFHETKNVISGEGGAILINDPSFASRAEIIREKGTDRSRFLRGQVDKYTWQDLGSSFLPSEILAAVLLAQLERADSIVQSRLRLWDRYQALLQPLEQDGLIRLPTVPAHCTHNAHIFYVLFRDGRMRDAAAEYLANQGIRALSHYVPLHDSPAGQRFGRTSGTLDVTERTARSLLRLPIHPDLSHGAQDQICQALDDAIRLRAS